MNEIESFSKPDKIKSLEIFKTRIIQDSVILDVLEDKNILHHVNILIDSINRSIFNLNNTNPNQKQNDKKDITSKWKKWIFLFNDNFKKLTGNEPNQKPNGVTIRIIESTIYKLEEKGADIDSYFYYLFEVFFKDPKNSHLLPNYGFIVSDFMLDKFFFTYKDVIEKNKLQEQKKVEQNDAINRYRVLLRKNTDNIEILEKLKNLYLSFKNGEIDMKDFKEKIIEMENVVIKS